MIILKYTLIVSAFFASCYWLSSTKYYTGPISDHFDGKKFYNKIKGEKSLFTVLKWQFTRNKPHWPSLQLPTQYDNPPKAVTGKKIRVSAVGHSTLLIQTHGVNILTDPIWSNTASPFSFIGPKRAIMPGIYFQDLPKIDIVLISHNHYDHMDKDTIIKLYQNHNPLFIVPLGNDHILRKMVPNINVKPLDWHENTVFADKVEISCYPVQHWSSRNILDHNKALWGSFILKTPSDNIYFAGDTGYGDGSHFREAQKEFKNFKLALLPIGAFKPEWFMQHSHMNPNEAVQAMLDLEAKHSIAIHFNTFPLADDAYDEPIENLKKSLSKHKNLDFKILNPGDKIFFD